MSICIQSQEKEFDYTDTNREDAYEKITSAKEYKVLAKREYQDFSIQKELKGLKGFHFRADEIFKTEENSTFIYGNQYDSENYRINVKTKIIGTQGVATVTYTNRTLRLKLSVIDDPKSVLKDSIVSRIKKISEKNKEKDYYAPWVIQLNRRGVFKNCDQYVFWDFYFTKEEARMIYWVNGKCLVLGIAAEPERFAKKEFQTWNKDGRSLKEAYLQTIKRLDYRGLYNYGQGCDFFIGGNEGGIKWKQNGCEILFECESNMESKEILKMIKE